MSHSIAIIGPGLLGASIALAARRTGSGRAAIWARRPEIVEEVRARKIADVVSDDLDTVIEGAETVVLCVPVGAMPALAREIVTRISPDTLVTDVGSVKASVVAELAPIFEKNGRFIGSHPMAGSDRAGHTFASAELFDGRVCILTPDSATRPDALSDATAFWQMLGCNVRTLAPSEHDEVADFFVGRLYVLIEAVPRDGLVAERTDG